MPTTHLTPEQVAQLLRPINPRRVARTEGNSNLQAYDVRAHLNRLFGFAGWDGEVLDYRLAYEALGENSRGKPAFSVGYTCRYRLTIRTPYGDTAAVYTEVATGDAVNFPVNSRGDAHDFAIKTAESQALKRCAMNLGDQFGLSLYNAGSLGPIVGRVLVNGPDPETPPAAGEDVTDHVGELSPETDPDAGAVSPDEPAEAPTPPPAAAGPAQGHTDDLLAAIEAASYPEEVTAVWHQRGRYRTAWTDAHTAASQARIEALRAAEDAR